MSVKTFCAAIFGAVNIVAAVPVSAADLDQGYSYGSAYDDPRYSDIYRHPAPPPPRYAAPYPSPPVYRDYYGEERYAAPATAPPPYYGGPAPQYEGDRYQGDRHQGDRRSRVACLPHDEIRDRLRDQGWHSFQDPEVVGDVGHIRARRPSGRMFELTIDRCSGQILNSQPLEGRRADIPPDWRYRDNRYGGY